MDGVGWKDGWMDGLPGWVVDSQRVWKGLTFLFHTVSHQRKVSNEHHFKTTCPPELKEVTL